MFSIFFICLCICLCSFLLKAFTRPSGKIIGGTFFNYIVNYMRTSVLLQKVEIFSVLLRDKLLQMLF